MGPPHCRYAPDASHVCLFDERFDRRKKPALAPGVFYVRGGDAEAFGEWGDDRAFRDIGVFGEECARDVVIKGSDGAIALFDAHEFGRLQRETRVNVTLRRVDWEPDFSSQTLESRANLRPVLRRKRLRRTLRRRFRMYLEGKPAEMSLQLPGSFLGPN
jgi:hypothetical protein